MSVAIANDSLKDQRSLGGEALRRYPYPYQAMLAICSDLDETPDAETYFELVRFLNTTERTTMGPGIGLEVGNSIYFDMTPGQLSYWNVEESSREKIRALIRSGHIDVLHSFGDLATKRSHALRALKELQKHDCRLSVWVDHAVAPTNFGADIMQGHGDEPGHPAYHADLTLDFGIRYVWRGRVTSVIGQDQPVSLMGIGDRRHPLASTKTIVKEAAKQFLARCGNSKYQLHQPNQILQPIHLRDGRPVFEFLRCNPHWNGVSASETGMGISSVLTHQFLDRLVERKGSCVLYTHLGKLGQGNRAFCQATIAAFQRLAAYFQDKKILVTTTRRLLDFHRMKKSVRVSVEKQNNRVSVIIGTEPSQSRVGASITKAELAGLTIYISDSGPFQLLLNGADGADAVEYVSNGPDETGKASISVPFNRLEYP